jgi:uncharacterized protein DUF3631
MSEKGKPNGKGAKPKPYNRRATVGATPARLKILPEGSPTLLALSECAEPGCPAFGQTVTLPPTTTRAGLQVVLALVKSFVRRYVSLSHEQARVIALWVAHTHAFDAAETTPYLSVNSPEKQSGKTRLLEVLELLVAHPWLTGHTSTAALVRKVDADYPTLLLDESDAAFRGERDYAEALRGVLNTGYRASGKYTRCVGEGANMQVRDFSTYCPKCIAGIGRLPDTVADRSIPIRLKRALPGTVAEFFAWQVQPYTIPVATWLAAWAEGAGPTLRGTNPVIPKELTDRQKDVSRPLLAIADWAGSDWPAKARAALVELCTGAQADDDSIRVRLLADIRAIFEERKVEEMPSGDLVDALAKIETSTWGEWSKGRPLSAAKLAGLLRPFGIRPDRIGGKNSQARGYKLSQFEDAFSRYLPRESVNPSTDREICGSREDFKPSTETPVDTSENAVSTNKDASVDTLTLPNRGEGQERDENAEPENPPITPEDGPNEMES